MSQLNTDAIIIATPNNDVIHAASIHSVRARTDAPGLVIAHGSSSHHMHTLVECDSHEVATALLLRITQDWRAGLREYAAMLALHQVRKT